MPDSTLNILLATIPGLGLPKTLTLPVPSSTTTSQLPSYLPSEISSLTSRLLITTNKNQLLSPTTSTPLSTYLSSPDDAFLPLRLTIPLCGGKGGFGSQLRAAGGRMSSRKKKQSANHDPNASNRNLSGRRIRTVNEAKALAEYLATKPEMDKKEKEERKRRLEAVVEQAEKREEEIRNGRRDRRMDGDWMEMREEMSEKVRQNVIKAMKGGDIKGIFGEEGESSGSGNASAESDGSESDMEDIQEEEKNGEAAESAVSKQVKESAKDEPKPKKPQAPAPRTFFGWDEDMSDDEEEDEDEEIPATKEEIVKGKGKAKA